MTPQEKYPDAKTFTFGDSAKLCDDLLALVRAGKKTATCGARRDFDDEPMPVVGRIDLALNWDGSPALAIRTLSVEEMPFSDVTEDFALAEGENDDLEGWANDHRAYFRRNGGWSPDMILVCERFEVVEDFA